MRWIANSNDLKSSYILSVVVSLLLHTTLTVLFSVPFGFYHPQLAIRPQVIQVKVVPQNQVNARLNKQMQEKRSKQNHAREQQYWQEKLKKRLLSKKTLNRVRLRSHQQHTIAKKEIRLRHRKPRGQDKEVTSLPRSKASAIASKEKRLAEQQLLTDMQAEKDAANSNKLLSSKILKYQVMITESIQQNVIIDSALKSKTCSLTVMLARSGLIVQVRNIKGDPAACRVAEAAVYKTRLVPVAQEKNLFKTMRVLNITLRPGG